MIEQLAAKADELKAIQEQRRNYDKLSDELKTEETRLTDELIQALADAGATSVGGKTVVASIVHATVPDIENWEEAQSYIKTHDAWDLVRRQLVDAAVKARWEAGEVIPGVGTRKVVKLSLTKPRS